MFAAVPVVVGGDRRNERPNYLENRFRSRSRATGQQHRVGEDKSSSPRIGKRWERGRVSFVPGVLTMVCTVLFTVFGVSGFFEDVARSIESFHVWIILFVEGLLDVRFAVRDDEGFVKRFLRPEIDFEQTCGPGREKHEDNRRRGDVDLQRVYELEEELRLPDHRDRHLDEANRSQL